MYQGKSAYPRIYSYEVGINMAADGYQPCELCIIHSLSLAVEVAEENDSYHRHTMNALNLQDTAVLHVPH
jgi:hypothetical protein